MSYNKEFLVRMESILEGGESVSHYTAGTDITNLAVSTNHLSGQYSIEFDKSGGTVAEGAISKPLYGNDAYGKSGLNLDEYSLDGVLQFSIYLSSIADIASVFVRLKEDGSNYLTWSITPTASGWVNLSANCIDGTQTGTGINWNSVKTLEFGVVMNNAADTLTDIKFDGVRMQLPSIKVDVGSISVNAASDIEGNVAHDATDSGNPVKVGGRARTSQIGAVGNDDRTDAIYNEYGEQVFAGHTWATSSNRVEEIDPTSSHHAESTLADVTNGADDTYYYYIDMDGYTGLSLHGELNGGSGTVTTTVEASLQDDGTAPASCAYQDITEYGFDDVLDGTANATYTADFYLTKKANINAKYIRVKVVAATGAADDADWTIYSKAWY